MKFSFMILFITLLLPSCFAEQSCRLQPDPRNLFGYIEITDDGRSFRRNCAPGTIYSKYVCVCITDTNVTRIIEAQRRCTPSLFYNFETYVEDKSEFALPALIRNVTISHNGTAVFSHKSRITIWRFANADFSSSLYITFSILITVQKSDQQIIFTNDKDSDIAADPSILATIHGNRYTFQLKTSARQETINIDQVPGFNNITVQYDGKTFLVTCNNQTVSRPLTGAIRTRYTPLSIGGFSGTSFTGELDDFRLFMCIPGKHNNGINTD